MIKRVTDINSLSGVTSPLLPLIYADFYFRSNDTDGVYVRHDDELNIDCVLSLKNGCVTVININSSVDIDELESFFEFCGVSFCISDYSFGYADEKALPLLLCSPKETDSKDVDFLSGKSNTREYECVYNLLSENGENFEQWFTVFSGKVNKGMAAAVYKSVDSVVVGTAVATGIYEDSAVISGVFTSVEHRNKGYATECVKMLLNRLYESGVKKVYLWCEEEKISFYNKFDFQYLGKIYLREDF